ncbi:hypothetical protein INT45_006132 [Circinella minor]|uniref:Uncharacterized protein n=1 Tax=Circinella minor TaxID=1195481 RepID=A0A8H7VHL3_9FUNG|nr:hypothetical protein INT45_006132 [Circinella minor]
MVGEMKHWGTHTHGEFIPLHFTMETLDKVEEHVLEFLGEKSYALKIGTSAIRVQKPSRPISSIDKNLCNIGTIKRLRRNYYLTKNDQLTSTQASFETIHSEFKELQKEFPGYIKASNIIPSPMCITFGAPGIMYHADFKTNSMLTDVTYSCFTKGYYLCTTNIYFEALGKFAVVFQGVLDGLSKDDFKAYFLSFLTSFDFVFGSSDADIDMNFSGLIEKSRYIEDI